MQKVFLGSGLGRGDCVAILTANRAETWCSGGAAQLCAAGVTWLHPLGSLENQLEDAETTALVTDAPTFIEQGGALTTRAARVKVVFTLGPAEYGCNLVAAAETAGAAAPVDFARPVDVSNLNHTRGAPENPRVLCGATGNIRSSPQRSRRFRNPGGAALPCRGSHQPCRRHQDPAGPDARGMVHLHNGFDPKAIVATIAQERVNFTLLVPTMICLLLDHPRSTACLRPASARSTRRC
jgi:fatty-acyl-CoA synthase